MSGRREPPEPTDGGEIAQQAPPRRRRGWWWWLKWTVRGLFLLAIAGVFVVGLDRLFYLPDQRIEATPADLKLAYEDVTFPTSDGLTLSAWFLPAVGEPRGTVIHFHGNAANIGNHVFASYWLVYERFNLLVFDYRGYGKSEGSPTRAGTIRDGLAAVDYLLSREDVDPKRIVALGQSLGGAVATVVAAKRPEIRAVVLDSTFGNYRHIGAAHLKKAIRWGWLADKLAAALLSDDYEPVDYVARISPRPVLVIASPDDEVCYAPLGRELYDAAAEPKEWVLVSGGRHLEVVADNVDNVQARIVAFYERALAASPAVITPTSAP